MVVMLNMPKTIHAQGLARKAKLQSIKDMFSRVPPLLNQALEIQICVS